MMALRYGKNKHQADDIFQEGLIQIFNSLDKYDDRKASFQTWSNRVLINTALNFLKKHSWQDRFMELDLVDEIVATEEIVYQKIAEQELTVLIQQLPLGYRLVFNLFAIEGYTHKEISTQLGISEGTSKSQLSKARRYLKEKLERHLIDSNHG